MISWRTRARRISLQHADVAGINDPKCANISPMHFDLRFDIAECRHAFRLRTRNGPQSMPLNYFSGARPSPRGNRPALRTCRFNQLMLARLCRRRRMSRVDARAFHFFCQRGAWLSSHLLYILACDDQPHHAAAMIYYGSTQGLNSYSEI